MMIGMENRKMVFQQVPSVRSMGWKRESRFFVIKITCKWAVIFFRGEIIVRS